MNATLRTLMARAIDYAGLFPPARLPLDAAVAEYRRALAGREPWMLGRFVCPASRLDELAGHWTAAEGPMLAAIALGSGGATVAELVERARADADAIRAFGARPGRRTAADQLEVRLPGDLVAACDPDAVRDVAAVVHTTVHRAARGEVLIALETPVAGAPPETVAAVAAGIARWNAVSVAAGRLPVCLKLRCGGADAAAVPAIPELAAALATARAEGVAVKATQGLHHPFRRLDPVLGVPAHGFLNLLAAAILGRANGLDATALVEILADDDPARFEITPAGLAWRDYRATLADVAAGRRFSLISFGSCSFAEPRDDLAALGHLEE